MSQDKNPQDFQEQAFLNSYDPRKYDLLSVSVDNVVFSVDCRVNKENYRKLDEQKLMVLLVKRKEHPFKGMWSLPGGFVRREETMDMAAYRTLNVKTGLRDVYLEQLYTFDFPGRDPRMRIISCAHLSLVDRSKVEFDSRMGQELDWFEVRLLREQNMLVLKSHQEDLSMKLARTFRQSGRIQSTGFMASKGNLAFDHASILLCGLMRLQSKIEYSDLIFNLMPQKFTIAQLQEIYEIILDQKLLAPAFRRKIAGKIIETGEYHQEKGHRPSQYYRFRGYPEDWKELLK